MISQSYIIDRARDIQIYIWLTVGLITGMLQAFPIRFPRCLKFLAFEMSCFRVILYYLRSFCEKKSYVHMMNPRNRLILRELSNSELLTLIW